MDSSRDVVILSAVRTAIGKYGGGLKRQNLRRNWQQS